MEKTFLHSNARFMNYEEVQEFTQDNIPEIACMKYAQTIIKTYQKAAIPHKKRVDQLHIWTS